MQITRGQGTATPFEFFGRGDDNCPACGHLESASPSGSALVARIRKRQRKTTCSHIDLIQDALVDDVDRCSCSDVWHTS